MIKNNIIYTPFSDWRFNLSKAKGSYIWDHKGNKYIDFTSAWNVTNLGWNHPEINKAIINQVKKNTNFTLWTSNPIQIKYAKLLTKSLPKKLIVVSRATGGTEANEEALKTARAYTGRKKIIGFKNTYHGQSFGTLAIGYLPEYKVTKSIAPLVPGFVQLDFPKVYGTNVDEEKILEKFEKHLEKILSNRDIAAIITEAGIITGWGSTYIAPRGYLKIVRRVTKKYKTLLILDEVGTGFSRCGKLFGLEIENIVPDIVTLAKGISNGSAAIGAMVTTKEIANKTFDKTNLTSTFGWSPVACAAALKTLKIHKRDKTWVKAKKDGKYILKVLKKELENNPYVEDINGLGMEIGVHFRYINEKKPLVEILVENTRKNGLHIVSDNENNIQIMPPLTIKRDELNRGLEILIGTISDTTESHS